PALSATAAMVVAQLVVRSEAHDRARNSTTDPAGTARAPRRLSPCSTSACRASRRPCSPTSDRRQRMITGKTSLIVHLGYPTESFKAPMIYNPWFETKGINAVVVPVGVEAAHYPVLLKALFSTTNVIGALITMPHKVTTTRLVDELTTTAKIAGACNAIRRRSD